ncbi:DUF1963 domain-containing protein [Streptomonospora algeriensis]|uniref:DUF1963 domain-containing protein n=1 Tax=Streptomonospora algeriensis TaxID=995084 RepID=A0ABW3BJX4_9ACTN
MSDSFTEKKSRLRAEALKSGVPSGEVERWLHLLRPCAALDPRNDGGLVGRYGGLPILPVSAPRPELWKYFVASVDCAAVPGGVTDLPLPSDGRLLFFAIPDLTIHGCYLPSEVVYVPAGTAVAELSADDEDGDGQWPLPRMDLRLGSEFSLPQEMEVEDPDHDLPAGFPHSKLLYELWCDIDVDEAAGGMFQLGGYAASWNNDPVELEPAEEDWVLLAQWYALDDVEELDLGIVHWVIRRTDLAERRFDRVKASADMVG